MTPTALSRPSPSSSTPATTAPYTHTALAAHAPLAGRLTLHPGPGTTSITALAHDLLASLGKPLLLPGVFPSGHQPAWEAATAWIHAAPITRLTVLRAHRLPHRRLEHLLRLRDHTGLRLILVCHRPYLPAALQHALTGTPHTIVRGLDAARRHYYGAQPLAAPSPPTHPASLAGRPRHSITLPALDRLISYDSPTPCPACCTPPPATWHHRPPPALLKQTTSTEVTRRLHAATSHPRMAAALATTLFTGASLQQLATTHPRDYHDTDATLTLHDRTHYTDGCATHPVPKWARPLLRAAACYAHHTTPEDGLLAHPGDPDALLRLAEAAKLRPPQPPPAKRTAPRGHVEWSWRERKDAERYDRLADRGR